MSRKKQMPPELMNQFMMGLEDNPNKDSDKWTDEVEIRSSRLGLGADPNKSKNKNPKTIQEKKILNMIKNSDLSDDQDEYKFNIPKRKSNNS